MKLAIMQPYIFPYIGYFQLIQAVDVFIVLDDVNFIKRGWINRNNIVVNNNASLFSFPLKGASQNKKIVEIDLVNENQWKYKFLKTIKSNYSKAPYFKDVFILIEEMVLFNELNLSKFITNQLKTISKYLTINTIIKNSYNSYNNEELKGEKRIIDICIKENASIYINPIGGQNLYNKNSFQEENIEMFFIESGKIKYKQFTSNFIPWLSIIDLLMFNSVEEINKKLLDYKLI